MKINMKSSNIKQIIKFWIREIEIPSNASDNRLQAQPKKPTMQLAKEFKSPSINNQQKITKKAAQDAPKTIKNATTVNVRSQDEIKKIMEEQRAKYKAAAKAKKAEMEKVTKAQSNLQSANKEFKKKINEAFTKLMRVDSNKPTQKAKCTSLTKALEIAQNNRQAKVEAMEELVPKPKLKDLITEAKTKKSRYLEELKNNIKERKEKSNEKKMENKAAKAKELNAIGGPSQKTKAAINEYAIERQQQLEANRMKQQAQQKNFVQKNFVQKNFVQVDHGIDHGEAQNNFNSTVYMKIIGEDSEV